MLLAFWWAKQRVWPLPVPSLQSRNVIVADEPTGSLDSARENVLEIFKELAEAGKTVIS